MVRWAILGTGFISNTVANSIRQSEGSSIVAVAGRSEATVKEFAARHGVPTAYCDYESALADPEIDAVYIGLPNHRHLPMVRQAAVAGKAILSEKSLTTTYRDALELIDCVRSHNVFFVEGLMYLAHPLFEKVASLLADRRLGTIRSINAIYAADIKDVVNPAGAGTLYNLGCYPASLLHFIVQDACGGDAFSTYEIRAVGNLNDDGNICDTSASIRFDSGLHATLQSTDSYGMYHAFEVIGENGSLKFCTNPWLPLAGDNVLEIKEHGEPVSHVICRDEHDAFYHQIRMVEACLERGDVQARRPSPRWNDSLEVMRLLTDWERAARA